MDLCLFSVRPQAPAFSRGHRDLRGYGTVGVRHDDDELVDGLFARRVVFVCRCSSAYTDTVFATGDLLFFAELPEDRLRTALDRGRQYQHRVLFLRQGEFPSILGSFIPGSDSLLSIVLYRVESGSNPQDILRSMLAAHLTTETLEHLSRYTDAQWSLAVAALYSSTFLRSLLRVVPTLLYTMAPLRWEPTQYARVADNTFHDLTVDSQYARDECRAHGFAFSHPLAATAPRPNPDVWARQTARTHLLIAAFAILCTTLSPLLARLLGWN